MHRPKRSSRCEDLSSGDDGSAPLEFVVVGLLLLVPLVYLIASLGIIQSHALGVESGARHLARAVAMAPDAAAAEARAVAVLGATAEEYGIDPATIAVEFACVPAGRACPRAGAIMVVSVAASVSLPLVPPVLGLDRIASVPVSASAVHKVSRFWGAE
ncbi:MAG TPA: TadE family protein [Microbacterium sp.]|nr:TadE family protein [Microbacterium sp.]